jgi:uncharacterized CHY-type Zn-finger protein
MRLIVCDSCEAEFSIRHNMNEDYYFIKYCPFCKSRIGSDPDFEDEIEWSDDE